MEPSTRSKKPITGLRILIVSDGTGETASQMIKAALIQFPWKKVKLLRYKNVRTETQIQALCKEAAQTKSLLVFTIVSPKLRYYIIKRAQKLVFPYVDLLGPLLVGLAGHLGYEPQLVAGLLHNVNDQYFQRIEAMEYTMAHDDGKSLLDLDKADLVILGISRTSKTPLSMYLSHQGWKVANIPIVRGFELPRELLTINTKRIVGLTIDPQELARIRRARLKRLGSVHGGLYADLERVYQEIEYAHEFFQKNRSWRIFDVTGKALEETATEIIKLMSMRGLLPEHLVLERASTKAWTQTSSPKKP